MVTDAVAVEPVSAAKFPANREKNSEYFNFGPLEGPHLSGPGRMLIESWPLR